MATGAAVVCMRCGRPAGKARRRLGDGVVCSACFSRQCRADQHQKNLMELTAAIVVVAPELSVGQLGEALRVAAPDLRESGKALRALGAEPRCLTNASSAAPPVIDRLVEALRAVGATGVQAPVCVYCGRSRWLTQRHGGRRSCAPCATARRVDACAVCGRQRPVGLRHADGSATCGSCYGRDPSRFTPCDGCGKIAVTYRRLDDGAGLCRSCSGRPIITCVDCGRQAPCYGGLRRGHPRCTTCGRGREECSRCAKTRPVSARLPGGPVCSTCWERALLAKAVCGGCGCRRRPDPRHPGDDPRCSDCAGLDALQVCAGCGDETRIFEAKRCRRCVLAQRVSRLLSGPDGAVRPELEPLRDALAATEPAKNGLRWIAGSEVAGLLRALAAGDLALDHGALDERSGTKAMAHLRAVLVAAGALPERDEVLATLEAWIGEHVAAVEPGEDRHIIDTYATWWVLRRYRQRALRHPIRDTSSGRSNVAAAASMLAWLRAHDRCLASVTQPDIDLWAATVSGSRRRAGHDFLRWATKVRLVHDLDIVRRPDAVPTTHSAPAMEQRAALAQRLLHDDDVALADRVAALFLILYAQPLSVIVGLSIADVVLSDDAVSIRFGRDPIELPEPLGALVARLVHDRTGHACVAADSGRWLFPGGQPGRHLHPERLGVRLNALGVRAREWRTNALLDLASDTPLVVLSHLLGLHTTTAYRWVQAAGGDWASYAAERVHFP